jgi:hypothetical protein
MATWRTSTYDLERIEMLTAISTAEDPITRGLLRDAAISINDDLVALHGIDLGPFRRAMATLMVISSLHRQGQV